MRLGLYLVVTAAMILSFALWGLLGLVGVLAVALIIGFTSRRGDLSRAVTVEQIIKAFDEVWKSWEEFQSAPKHPESEEAAKKKLGGQTDASKN